MEKHNQYYNRPVLREGVVSKVRTESASFSYWDTSFEVDFSPELKPALGNFLKRLEKGLDIESFEKKYPEFTSFAGDLFSTFDRYGFVTESSMPENGKYISGLAFWKEIDRYVTQYLGAKELPLAKRFLNGQIDKPILLNYALQYYHFVKAGPQIIASAMANADRSSVRDILEHFLVSELGHDKLLLKSLAGEGIKAEKVKKTIPLPETFALITAYQVMADQEPLSFYASVFLVEEERPGFNQLFKTTCKQLGLSEAFYKPILAHSEINEEEDHGEISREILQHYTMISSETRMVVLKQIQHILNCMIALESAIIREAEVCFKSIK